MKISIAIMAHPDRTVQAVALYNKVVQYPFVAPHIIWDQQNSEWHTGRRALAYGIGKADVHVVLQDDAIINEHFFTNLEKALKAAPIRTCVSLYTGTVRPFNDRVTRAVATAKDGSWLSGYLLFWGVAIALPTEHIEPLLEFCDTDDDPYDTRIGKFYFGNMTKVLYTNPSLVDHDDDIGSLIEGRDDLPQGKRVARNMIANDVDWTGTITEI